MLMRRKGLVVALCLTALVVGGAAYALLNREGAPGRGDIDISAFVAYPGSTMTKDLFQKADHGRYIDTGSFSNPTQLIRRYKLAEPVPRSEFERWRSATYPQPGWQLTATVDASTTVYKRTVGKVHHYLKLSVIAGGPEKPLVPEYEILYSVS